MNWNPFKTITYVSRINGKITLGTQRNKKAIFAGGVTQSGGELVIMWDSVLADLHKHGVRVQKFLLLGVGAGMIFSIVKKYYPKAEMVGIDIDPIMKQIAEKHFGWKDSPSEEIIISDAISWMKKKAPKNYFDLIAVDIFIGPRNAPKTRTELFLRYLQNSIRENGSILYNAHYEEKKNRDYKKFRKITDTLFKNVEEVYSYPLNRLLLLRKKLL